MADDEDFTTKIPKLKETFAELFAGSLNSGLYDERDIERLRLDDEHALAYLRHQKGNIEKAAIMMDVCLKWRKDMQINDLTHKSFPREMHDTGAVYWHNEDNKGHKILYFCIKKNKKDPERLLMVKQFVAWHIEKHHSKHPGERIVALLDMTDTGFTNMDMDLIKFQIATFTTYFPGCLAYMLIYEMPWVLNAIWTVIKTLLSTEQQKAVIFVKQADIQKYIDDDQLWKHMGGMDDYEYTYIPSEDSGIELNNGDRISTSDDEDLSENAGVFSSTVTLSPSGTARKRVTFSKSDSVVYTSFDGDSTSLRSLPDSLDNQMNGDPCRSPLMQNNNISNNTPEFSVQRRAADDPGNVFESTILKIFPAEDLEFLISDDNDPSVTVITLHNVAAKNVIYKIKTTSPDKYRVRPSTGIIQPDSSTDIRVHLHASCQSAAVNQDKFLIMFMTVGSNVAASEVSEFFKLTNRKTFSEHRLQCVLTYHSPGGDTSLAEIAENVSKLGDQMETLLSSHKRLEYTMNQVRSVTIILVVFIVLLLLTILLTYWSELLPINKYSTNACLPSYW